MLLLILSEKLRGGKWSFEKLKSHFLSDSRFCANQSRSLIFSLKPSLGLNCFAKLSPSVDFHKAIK